MFRLAKWIVFCSVVFFQIGCGDGGSGISGDPGTSVISTSNGSATSNTGATGLNGPLLGDIWYSKGTTLEGETRRFNLESGTDSRITSGIATPSRDGTRYVLHRPDVGEINVCDRFDKYDVVEVRNTRTHSVEASFQTTNRLGDQLKLSPDGSRILSKSNEHIACFTSSNQSENIAVYSTSGEVLLWADPKHYSADWLPDGRLALLSSAGGRKLEVNLETAPGSNSFIAVTEFALDDSLGNSVGEFSANAAGDKFLIEIISEQSHSDATVYYRYSAVLLMDFSTSVVRNIFLGNESDGTLRASAGVFSPDGNWLLTTHDYSTGQIGTNSFIAIDLPPATSYVVPVQTTNLPLPPNQIGPQIQPLVVRTSNGRIQTTGLNPRFGQVWTPTIR